MDKNQNYTLITGASKGIGKAFAFECAQRKMNLLLIARNEDLLASLKTDLVNSYSISVDYLSIDLTQENACVKIFEFINEKNISVNILINNAGAACYANFEESILTKNIEIIKLNIEATIKLTHMYLAHYDRSQKCYLLNVISTSAFQPIPGLSIYAATKSFLLSFTKSLQYEQKSANLFISALCPGPVKSEFTKNANMDHVYERNKMWFMAVPKIASIGMNGLLRHKKLIIPGYSNKLHIFFVKIIPLRIILYFTEKFYKVGTTFKFSFKNSNRL